MKFIQVKLKKTIVSGSCSAFEILPQRTGVKRVYAEMLCVNSCFSFLCGDFFR